LLRILEMTHADLAAFVGARYGKGPYWAGMLYREFHKHHHAEPWKAGPLSRSPELSRDLARDWRFVPGTVVREAQDAGVVKFVTELADGHRIESVVIPMATHGTVCVSSQVGCRLGCRFCETATMGLVRNLTVEEITGQVYAARRRFGETVRNVVFMGMGEPMENFDAVAGSIRVLADQRGFDIARRRITLSTAGQIHGIDSLAERADLAGVNLAVSLNAAEDGLRNRLMPVNRSMPLAALQRALTAFSRKRGAAVMINYVVIPGMNDSRRCAHRLAEWITPFRARVNLIPFNAGSSGEFREPLEEEIAAFRDRLIKRGVNAQLRHSRGRPLMAACGQLGARDPRAQGVAIQAGKS